MTVLKEIEHISQLFTGQAATIKATSLIYFAFFSIASVMCLALTIVSLKPGEGGYKACDLVREFTYMLIVFVMILLLTVWSLVMMSRTQYKFNYLRQWHYDYNSCVDPLMHVTDFQLQ